MDAKTLANRWYSKLRDAPQGVLDLAEHATAHLPSRDDADGPEIPAVQQGVDTYENTHDRRTDTTQSSDGSRRVFSHGSHEDLTKKIRANSLVVHDALKYGRSPPGAKTFGHHVVDRDSHGLNEERDQRLLNDRPLARDEPLSHGDYADRRRCLTLTDELHQHPRLHPLLIGTTREAKGLARISGFPRLREEDVPPSLLEKGSKSKNPSNFGAVIAQAGRELHHRKRLLGTIREESLPV
jgi:hypothetical protein